MDKINTIWRAELKGEIRMELREKLQYLHSEIWTTIDEDKIYSFCQL